MIGIYSELNTVDIIAKEFLMTLDDKAIHLLSSPKSPLYVCMHIKEINAFEVLRNVKNHHGRNTSLYMSFPCMTSQKHARCIVYLQSVRKVFKM